ncbi:MAG: hypothetical protein QGH40_03105, partial [bacterium]|nr:hypothetical protein [bacterium]
MLVRSINQPWHPIWSPYHGAIGRLGYLGDGKDTVLVKHIVSQDVDGDWCIFFGRRYIIHRNRAGRDLGAGVRTLRQGNGISISENHVTESDWDRAGTHPMNLQRSDRSRSNGQRDTTEVGNGHL